MGKPPLVIQGTFELPSGRVCSVGDASWYGWLESEAAKSFRFEGESGSFTARKENPSKGSPYWMANRRVNGQLRKGYLGQSSKLDIDYLESVAERLADPGYQPLSKAKPAAESDSTGSLPKHSQELSLGSHPDFLRLQEQVTELQRQFRELLTQSKEGSDTQSQLATLQAENQELKRRNRVLTDLVADLTARREDAEAASARLCQRVTELARERETLAQGVASLTDRLTEATANVASLTDRLTEATANVAQYDNDSHSLTPPVPLVGDSAQNRSQLPDLSAVRARILAALKMGKQAPGYKAAAKALAEFVREIELSVGGDGGSGDATGGGAADTAAERAEA